MVLKTRCNQSPNFLCGSSGGSLLIFSCRMLSFARSMKALSNIKFAPFSANSQFGHKYIDSDERDVAPKLNHMNRVEDTPKHSVVGYNDEDYSSIKTNASPGRSKKDDGWLCIYPCPETASNKTHPPIQQSQGALIDSQIFPTNILCDWRTDQWVVKNRSLIPACCTKQVNYFSEEDGNYTEYKSHKSYNCFKHYNSFVEIFDNN